MENTSQSTGGMPASSARPLIILVGIGHVFDIRSAVMEVIRRAAPNTVAIELDGARYQALRHRERTSGRGLPFTYRLLAKVQENLAEQYGSEVGDEMLAAVDAALQVGARVELIDMDSAQVFRRMITNMTMKERVLMAMGIFLALFAGKGAVEKELEMYKTDEKKFMAEAQRAYPTMTRVLIDDRNEHMAKRLRDISASSSVTLAVVGDGHVSGIQRLVSEFAEVEVRRLGELQTMPREGQNTQFTMSFEVRRADDKP